MAFDMYAGDRQEKIASQDKFIFYLASRAPERYPELNAIWMSFHSDPRVSAEQAGALVHELLSLYEEQTPAASKPLAALVLRLATFFSAASRSNREVRCSSD